MNFIVNNIAWWQISLEALVNSWIPRIATFLLGLWLSRIDEHRKLKRKLKDEMLEIFISVFNSGQSISLSEAEDAAKRIRYTLNAYKGIGACQASCRLFHAAIGCMSMHSECALMMESRSGLSVTAPMGDQLRVARDQRAGFSSRAWLYSA